MPGGPLPLSCFSRDNTYPIWELEPYPSKAASNQHKCISLKVSACHIYMGTQTVFQTPGEVPSSDARSLVRKNPL